MPPRKIAKIKWIELESILDRRIWVYYLIILDRLKDRFKDVIEARPDARFFEELNRRFFLNKQAAATVAEANKLRASCRAAPKSPPKARSPGSIPPP